MSSHLKWNCGSCGLLNSSRILCQACFSSASLKIRKQIISATRELLNEHNQSHVLNHVNVNDLNCQSDLNRLLLQIHSIDFEYIKQLYIRAMAEEQAMKASEEENKQSSPITPFPHKDAFNISNIGNVEKLCTSGLKAIADGKCCVILLAGGQGTRLGFNKPKGCFDIGLPSKKSIYQLQIEKILAVKRAAGAKVGINDPSGIRFPIYFMTSEATHADTQQFLTDNDFFTFPSDDITLFKQSLFPCLTEKDGKFIMKSASEIAMNPNGNGGIYSSLKQSGVYQKMKDNGIEYIQIFGIDNILARIGDPLWYGHMIESGADASNKTCLKTDPLEKVGVMCLRNGKPAVTEYTELSKDMIELRQKDSKQLEYCYGNLAMHAFNMDFISKICDDSDNSYPLPVHVARKQIPCYDPQQRKTVKPESANGIKLEFFVFDTFQFSRKCTVYNIVREEEFAPVKNADGKDSPLTARRAYSAYWKQQILKNGGMIENGKNENALCEVSPLFAYLPYGDGGAFKQRVKGKTFKLPLYL